MAITFKYRNHLSLSYAPGISVPGKDGLPGKKGISGNSMYFVDFDLDNSYSIDLALQKIENNKILTNDSNLDINSRPYKANDILISNTGNVYKIVNSTGNEFKTKNYKFDIKFLGKLHKSVESGAIKMVIYDITGLVVENYRNQFKYFPARQVSCVPTNRCEPEYQGTDYNDDECINSGSTKTNCYMYGAWIKPVLWTHNNLTTEATPLEKRLKYSLILELNNTKELIGTRAPGSSDSVKFVFNKNLEFVSPGIAAADSSVSPENVIFTDEFLMGLTGRRHSPYKAIYLSDMHMDKYHPSGNNLQCTLSEDENIWYKIGRDSYPANVEDKEKSKNWLDYPSTNYKDIDFSSDDLSLLSMSFGKDAYVKDDNGEDKLLCEKTIDDYTSAISYYAKKGADASETIFAKMFPRYAIGKSLNDINDSAFANPDAGDTYNPTIKNIIESKKDVFGLNYCANNLLLTDKRIVKVDKFRAGDSAYFSSIAINKDYDTSTNGILSNNVSEEIFDFIADDKNTYKLVIKKIKNKTVTISDIAVEFNTVTFRNAYYKQYTEGGFYYRQDYGESEPNRNPLVINHFYERVSN